MTSQMTAPDEAGEQADERAIDQPAVAERSVLLQQVHRRARRRQRPTGSSSCRR